MVLLKFYLNHLGKQPRCQRFKRFSTSILPYKLIHEGVPGGLTPLYLRKSLLYKRTLKAGTTFTV